MQPGMCSGLAVRDEHVDRAAGRLCDAVCEETVGRRHVRPSDRRVGSSHESHGQVAKPIGVGARVVVEVGDDLTARMPESDVSCSREPAVLGGDDADVEVGGNLRSAVGRPVVDHEHLEVRIVERSAALEAFGNRRRSVVRADDHADARPIKLEPQRGTRERLLDRCQRGLGRSVGTSQTETPVVDVGAAAVPLVRPREDEGAGAARGESRRQLPGERIGLRLVAVSQAVEPQLGDDERAIAREGLQPCQVGLELLFRFEEDVEADEIEERELEVFGRGIVDVRDEGVGIFLRRHAVELFQELLDSPAPVPAHDRSRDLVADRIGEHGRVAGAFTNAAAHAIGDGSHAVRFAQKGDMLFPGDPTRTKRPSSSATSSSHRGGTLYVRTALIPWARIAAKSVATVDGAGYSQPSSSGRNVP